MGYTTDILGHATVTPRLNLAEIEFLAAFAQSRRWARPDGPYAVPWHPVLDDRPDPTDPKREDYNRPAMGQPGLWCDWAPAAGGRILTYDGHEKFYRPADWLRYLIEHFLAPGAEASKSGDPTFEEFTFDHVLEGIFAARRRDTTRLWLIRVRANQVREQTLIHGISEAEAWESLPYEDEIDRFEEMRRRRRKISTQSDLVYRLPA